MLDHDLFRRLAHRNRSPSRHRLLLVIAIHPIWLQWRSRYPRMSRLPERDTCRLQDRSTRQGRVVGVEEANGVFGNGLDAE